MALVAADTTGTAFQVITVALYTVLIRILQAGLMPHPTDIKGVSFRLILQDFASN